MERETSRTRCIGDDGSTLVVIEYQHIDHRRPMAASACPGARRATLAGGEPVRSLGDGVWEVIATGEVLRRA
ncbi:hypothetical protein [Sphingomonas asaccharolytica]|uniref:hypothetical protein n=1 Tax=Sphingomonas asaccharolytica TaxID=40681 RepID=UPI000833A71F|nr:hypothetical protein [Sphingomonas asaccharolytica]